MPQGVRAKNCFVPVVGKDPVVILSEDLAKGTWERLMYSLELGIFQGEEIISDINLQEMKRSGITRIADPKKFSKKDEAKFGVDWECWIGSSKHGWLKFAAQAKKLKLETRRYSNLSYKVHGRRQVEILREYANKKPKAIPVYCLNLSGL